jgi:sirohydrochlorin ferrochelatase
MTKPSTRRALIVAHGQPSDPAPAEADLARLAASVAALLPDWQVTSATLANPNSLVGTVTGEVGIVYPMFMSGGWFTSVHLPERLAAAGGENWRILAPFGLDPNLQALTAILAQEATTGHPQAEVLLAAHGSFRSSAPSDVAYDVVRQLLASGLNRAEAAFIDQSPRIVDVARGFGPNAVCLPFFAAAGGHVVDDLPQALAEAGFAGRLLAPIGLDARVPGLIARAFLATMLELAID